MLEESLCRVVGRNSFIASYELFHGYHKFMQVYKKSCVRM